MMPELSATHRKRRLALGTQPREKFENFSEVINFRKEKNITKLAAPV